MDRYRLSIPNLGIGLLFREIIAIWLEKHVGDYLSVVQKGDITLASRCTRPVPYCGVSFSSNACWDEPLFYLPSPAQAHRKYRPSFIVPKQAEI